MSASLTACEMIQILYTTFLICSILYCKLSLIRPTIFLDAKTLALETIHVIMPSIWNIQIFGLDTVIIC